MEVSQSNGVEIEWQINSVAVHLIKDRQVKHRALSANSSANFSP